MTARASTCGAWIHRTTLLPPADKSAMVVDYNRTPGVHPAAARLRLRGVLRPDLRAGRSAARSARAGVVDRHAGRAGAEAVRGVARLQRVTDRPYRRNPGRHPATHWCGVRDAGWSRQLLWG